MERIPTSKTLNNDIGTGPLDFFSHTRHHATQRTNNHAADTVHPSRLDTIRVFRVEKRRRHVDCQSRGVDLTARQFGGGKKVGPMSRYRHGESKRDRIEKTRR